MIRKLKYHEIDFEKYQNCLETSEQRKYSATKQFLDVTSGCNWELLVYQDYEAVMPIPFIEKFGFKVVVNPKLTQQLGIFSSEDSIKINEKFLAFFKKNYKIWYYAFNESNKFKTELSTRKNFILKSESYEIVRQRYSPKRKRKLRLNPGVIEFSEIKEKINFNEVKYFIYENMIGAGKKKDLLEYIEILQNFSNQNLLDLYGFYFKGNLTNLIAVYQENYTSVLLGTYNIRDLVKQNGASNLIDFAIMKNVETKIFDFEGGDLPNMDEYFRGFRAEEENYCVIQNDKINLIRNFFRV